jgi:diguanylate cyclase (GGDEF)-like protein
MQAGLPDTIPHQAPDALDRTEPLALPLLEDERPRTPALSPGGWFVSALGMILCVGAADYLTRPELLLILFYLAPIGLGTWFASLRWGVALAVLSALVSTGSDTLYRAQHHLGDLAVAAVCWNGLMLLGTALSLAVTLSALKGRLEAEELLARTDALTRIANRRAFFESASLELERARRSGRPLTVAYVDLDDFKHVNDRLGHARGDELLVTVAQTLRSATRAVDAVARLGGDEFGLILPETDAATAEAILSRVRGTLLATRQGEEAFGFSVGAAVFLVPPRDVDELTARADELMYIAKRSAKGSIRIGVFEGAQVWASAIPG